MNDSDRFLATEIEAAVRGQTGVTGVYPSGSMLSKAADTTARLLSIRDEDAPLALVERQADGVRVEIAIGADTSEGVAVTAYRASAVIQELLESQGMPDAEIRLTVVHVAERRPS